MLLSEFTKKGMTPMNALTNMIFHRQLPSPEELRQAIPLSPEGKAAKVLRDQEIADILSGKDDRLLLIIGPCSADREDAVLDYICLLYTSRCV